MLKSIDYIYHSLRINRKVAGLNIEKAGVDESGMAYVKIVDGLTFFGPKSRSKVRKYYNLLPSKVKNTLPFDAYTTACDIVIRFCEGSLKVGGSKKEGFYKVKGGDVVAEMGAFRGYFSMHLSKAVGENGKVIAIEPIPENVKFLQKNVEYNQLHNVTVIPKGVWKEKDTLTFDKKSEDGQSGSISIERTDSDKLSIEVDSLDNILAENDVTEVDHMTIQLNGVEFQALEGLKTVKPRHLSIAARYEHEGEDVAMKVNGELVKRGYQVESIDKVYLFASENNPKKGNE